MKYISYMYRFLSQPNDLPLRSGFVEMGDKELVPTVTGTLDIGILGWLRVFRVTKSRPVSL